MSDKKPTVCRSITLCFALGPERSAATRTAPFLSPLGSFSRPAPDHAFRRRRFQIFSTQAETCECPSSAIGHLWSRRITEWATWATTSVNEMIRTIKFLFSRVPQATTAQVSNSPLESALQELVGCWAWRAQNVITEPRVHETETFCTFRLVISSPTARRTTPACRPPEQ